MKFIDTAIEMEELTQKYYLDLAEKCAANEGLKNILRKLAHDHEQHIDKFKQIAENVSSEFKIITAYDSTINFFRELQKDKGTFSCDIDQLNMYKKALELVGKKLVYYNKCEAELEGEKNQEILQQIIKEENQHRFILQNLIEMISRPMKWIENAEFHHMEKY